MKFNISTATSEEKAIAPAGEIGKPGAIIINGCFQGLGVLRNLAEHGVPVYLLDRGMCVGRFSKYAGKFSKCPDIGQEELFSKFLVDLAIKENLEGWLIYPNDDRTIYFLSRHKKELEQYFRVATPSWEITRLAFEKKLTYQLSERYGIAVPKTFYPNNIGDLKALNIEFPAIIKPSVKEPFYSTTRKKAIRLDNFAELLQQFTALISLGLTSDLMVQEMIPGGPRHLYSVGSLFKQGEFLGKVIARRVRQHPMDFGHATTYAETVDIPELEDIARKILTAIGYYGLSEVEFMFDPRDKRFKLIEINARPWGWHTLAIGAGVDLPYMLYQDMMGEKIKANGFEKNVKWIHLVTDTPTVLSEIIKGRMTVTDYFKSLQGRKQFAVLSFNDPLPFIAEILMIPYLWKRRGF